MIDWQRMARPQADGYDTQQLIPLALERYGWTKATPAHDATTWAHGTVTIIRPSGRQGEHAVPAPLDHPNLELAAEMLLKVWPEMYGQCQDLLESITVYIDETTREFPNQTGCSCGPIGDRVSFQLSTTINGAIGMLEGIVHEMGHSKLKPMGMSMYHWDRLLANELPTAEAIESGVGENLYGSPIRKDKLRPLGACFSAHYSYLHVTDLLQRIVRSGVEEIDQLAPWLEVMCGRIRVGEKLVANHVQPTEEGEPFFAACTAWADELLSFEA